MTTYKVGDEVEVTWRGESTGWAGVGRTVVSKVDGNKVTVEARVVPGKSKYDAIDARTFDSVTGLETRPYSGFILRPVINHATGTRIKVTGVPHYSGTYTKLANGRYKREGKTNRTVPGEAILGGTVTVLTATGVPATDKLLSGLVAGSRLQIVWPGRRDLEGVYTVVEQGNGTTSSFKRESDGFTKPFHDLVNVRNPNCTIVLLPSAPPAERLDNWALGLR